MAYDWGARLDGRGYHRTSIVRPDTDARWTGAISVADDGWVDGKSIQVYSTKEEGMTLNLNQRWRRRVPD